MISWGVTSDPSARPRRAPPRPAGRTACCSPGGLLVALSDLVDADPLAPVAEALARGALGAEGPQRALEQGRDLVQRHVAGEEAVEPGAGEVAAQEDVVLAERGAHEADVPQVG